MGLAERQAKCWALTRKHYAGVPSREWFIDQAVCGVVRPSDPLLDAGSGSTLPLLNNYAKDVSFAVGPRHGLSVGGDGAGRGGSDRRSFDGAVS